MDFDALYDECARLLAGSGDPRTRLQALCDLVAGKVPHYDWFGFYIAAKAEKVLVLGPFTGEPTDHVRIPFGTGICGQAAADGETFVVDDVSAEGNYLACSLKVKSEIVVPVPAPDDTVAGEIDIDSHSKAAFGIDDVAFLERLSILVARDVQALRA